MKEIELRFSVNSFDGIRKKLIELGAEIIKRKKDNDWYFRHHLDGDRSVVRIRNWKKLTVKAGEEGRWDEEEIEFFADKQTILNFLNLMGFHKVLTITKLREQWRLGKFEINLDDVEGLGKFLEIEGGNWENIENLAMELGVNSNPMREGYVRLLERKKD